MSEATALCFIEGRISFQGRPDGGGHNASFASAIAVFGECSPDLLDALAQLGIVFDHSQQYERTEQLTLEHTENIEVQEGDR